MKLSTDARRFLRIPVIVTTLGAVIAAGAWIWNIASCCGDGANIGARMLVLLGLAMLTGAALEALLPVVVGLQREKWLNSVQPKRKIASLGRRCATPGESGYPGTPGQKAGGGPQVENGVMSERFAWVPDLDRGEWLRPMEAEPWGSILSIVPRGFEAYARVFHPVDRDRPRETRTWQGVDQAAYFTGVGDIEASLETEPATWAQAAASFGTTMHAQAQYARLVRGNYGEVDGVISADGWRYSDTSEGCLDTASLAAASAVLARHTTTPDAGVAAIWEGWGGLVSSTGAARFVLELGEEWPAPDTDEDAVRVTVPSLRERLTAALRQGLTGAHAVLKDRRGLAPNDPGPGSGLLSQEVAAGPRFELHGSSGRRYVLFEAGAGDFADAAWPTRAPWVDDAVWAHSPSILWPDDHAWVLATEIDFDSTLVAGTTALVRELVRTPGVEALPIRTDADLTWDGDTLNRPQ